MAPKKNVRFDAAANKFDGAFEDTWDGASGVRIMRIFDLLLYFSIPGLILLHLTLAPYTKVEESFNIQATHDVLVYGMPISNIHQRLSHTYDHFTFPGAVPRTFLGPVLLAGVAQPVIAITGFQHAQLTVRAILGLFNAAALLIFARNLRRAYGPGTARWYLMLQASQFHIIFYASRTLPNMFAFGLTTLAFAFLLPQPSPNLVKSTPRRQRLAITLLVLSAVVFRSEIALLLGTNILYLLLLPAISLERVIYPFLTSFLLSLAISVPIDSYFWQKFPIWPELWGFYYNVVQGSSSNWGVSPWYYYFASAIPRLLVNPLTWTVLIPLAWYHPSTSHATKRLTIPSLLFVAIYSIQPHKEARFIFYVVPPLTAAAALGANTVFNQRGKSFLSSMLALAMIVSIIASLAVSTGMLLLSSLNYPGGEALSFVRSTVLAESASSPDLSSAVVPVHADVLSCMTGVTLFGTATGSTLPNLAPEGGLVQQHGHGVTIAVDKTEESDELETEEFWRRFGYVLTEEPEKLWKFGGGESEWENVGVVRGFAGVEIVKPGQEDDEAKSEVPVVGKAKTVAMWKRRVEAMTGGWWIGPRMADRVYILQRLKNGKRWVKGVDA
ncbi:Alg9-like mannosyltransferase family-domain-containing protein [Podospora fimiseda]|uniref:Mannosyltransferase n=1 Tax=Podospora fimiseda TaxID=252190 RepID=A0AAN7H2A0_9PEZI|nr:Alg9-like mannosyltransferase family-domain-containing protein [Podospora fimiseda]